MLTAPATCTMCHRPTPVLTLHEVDKGNESGDTESVWACKDCRPMFCEREEDDDDVSAPR